jgi:hypothetical protein
MARRPIDTGRYRRHCEERSDEATQTAAGLLRCARNDDVCYAVRTRTNSGSAIPIRNTPRFSHARALQRQTRRNMIA